jgi:hypothetical protein
MRQFQNLLPIKLLECEIEPTRVEAWWNSAPVFSEPDMEVQLLSSVHMCWQRDSSHTGHHGGLLYAPLHDVFS